MKAFLLAAGAGERLRPITDTVPKPLLPVGRLPLIEFGLRLVAHHGIEEVIVNLHHHPKALQDALGDGSRWGVKITYSIEEELLGTGGGLKRMHDALADETFVVLNADTIIDLDIDRVLEAHRASRAIATLVLRRDPRQAEFGQIEVDGEGRVRRILGQGEPSPEPLEPLIFTGVHVVEPRLLEYIPPDLPTCVMRYAYQKALANGEYIHGVPAEGYWTDAGTPERYLLANEDVMLQRMSLRHVDPLEGYALQPRRAVGEVVRLGKNVDIGTNSRIAPPVLLGDGVRIGEHAAVGPFVNAGPKVQIGKGASVRHAVLLEGARVDGGEDLRAVIVGKKARLQAEWEALDHDTRRDDRDQG